MFGWFSYPGLIIHFYFVMISYQLVTLVILVKVDKSTVKMTQH